MILSLLSSLNEKENKWKLTFTMPLVNSEVSHRAEWFKRMS